MDSDTNWRHALAGVTAVVHLAARVHVMSQQGEQALDEYRRVNVDGTLNLARQAEMSGVKRFIYISTVKVHGEESGSSPFRPGDIPAPKDHYSISKLEAENGLRAICDVCQMELVVVRPPLVYGRGAKGNFARLVKMVKKGLYLPLGNIRNKRSLIGMDNFCSLINACIDHPDAPGKVFLVSDGQDVSTADLIRLIAKFSDNPVRLFGVPPKLLLFSCRLVGLEREMKKLTGNLQVDSSDTMKLLNWRPPFTLEQGIARVFARRNVVEK
jgi:nucleoside-diphosphate-sugar epimerase